MVKEPEKGLKTTKIQKRNRLKKPKNLEVEPCEILKLPPFSTVQSVCFFSLSAITILL